MFSENNFKDTAEKIDQFEMAILLLGNYKIECSPLTLFNRSTSFYLTKNYQSPFIHI